MPPGYVFSRWASARGPPPGCGGRACRNIVGPGSSYYKLTAPDFAGNQSAPASASVTVGVQAASLPARFALHPAAPNPLRSGTVFRYDVSASGGRMHLGVYDVGGRLVRVLVDGPQAPGAQRVAWDGRDERGRELPTGVYLVRMSAPGFAERTKLLIAR